MSLAMVLLDRFSLAGSFNIITVVTIRINHIYPMTRVMTPESPEMLNTGKLAAASRKQLADMELKHHVLGRSFP